jgi:hypothetical protein
LTRANAGMPGSNSIPGCRAATNFRNAGQQFNSGMPDSSSPRQRTEGSQQFPRVRWFLGSPPPSAAAGDSPHRRADGPPRGPWDGSTRQPPHCRSPAAPGNIGLLPHLCSEKPRWNSASRSHPPAAGHGNSSTSATHCASDLKPRIARMSFVLYNFRFECRQSKSI